MVQSVPFISVVSGISLQRIEKYFSLWCGIYLKELPCSLQIDEVCHLCALYSLSGLKSPYFKDIPREKVCVTGGETFKQ